MQWQSDGTTEPFAAMAVIHGAVALSPSSRPGGAEPGAFQSDRLRLRFTSHSRAPAVAAMTPADTILPRYRASKYCRDICRAGSVGPAGRERR